MPSTNEELARVIGLLNPKVIPIRLQRGEKFTTQGITADGRPYELRYEIQDFNRMSITLKMDGSVRGGPVLRDNTFRFSLPLKPNELFRIPKGFNIGQSDLYIAFLAPSASEFKPHVGGPLILALGEVRDTVPPPQPPPKK